MKKVAFYDAKSYDKEWFDKVNNNRYEIIYFDANLNEKTAILAKDCSAVIGFVNDDINKEVLNTFFDMGIRVIALRSSGYNNVDIKAAYKKINVLRVPSYSPHAIAEYTMGLLLMLCRKYHKSYNRTRDFNFSLDGLMGFNLYQKTLGVIGTGKIGSIFVNIAKGFGMNVIAYDKYPKANIGIDYVQQDELFIKSDIISLHCPLTYENKHLINKKTISKMKEGVYLINTSRGALIESKALLEALQSEKIAGAALDVYEEETEWFFEDNSMVTAQNEMLSLLISQPNVILTSHQAFFTIEAIKEIAKVTFYNLDCFFAGNILDNEICYKCSENKNNCTRDNGRCFWLNKE